MGVSGLEPYLPRVLVDALATDPTLGPGKSLDLSGVVCFLDLAGFTPMTEMFGEEGPAGTEALTLVINELFEPLIDHVCSHGGDVICFAGDAMTIVFPDSHDDPDQQTHDDDALAVCEDLVRLVGSRREFRRGDRVALLRVKVGVARGPLTLRVVGTDSVRSPMLSGDALDRAADAEHSADPGQVVVDPSLRHSVGENARPPRSSTSTVDPTAPVEPTELASPESSAVDQHALLPYLHPAVAARIELGAFDLLDEHRQVTTAFVGLAVGDEQLDRALATIVRLARRAGGFVAQTDAGDKGVKVLVLFGAPTAEPDPEIRAAGFGAATMQALGSAVRIGLTTGVNYVGSIGSQRRRQYTALGDAVNLAARLMQVAPAGSVLGDALTAARGHPVATWVPLEPVMLKGKAEPVVPHRLDEVSETGRVFTAGSLSGRDGLIAELLAAHRRTRAGSGHSVVLHGAAGAGKTAICRIVGLELDRRDVAVLWGAADQFGLRGPYALVHQVMVSILDLPDEPSRAQVQESLARLLHPVDPAELRRWTPEVEALIGGVIPHHDTPDDARRAAEVRAELFVDLLSARLGRDGGVIVLDDIDRADDASRQLIALLVRRLGSLGVLVLATARDPGSPGVVGTMPTADMRSVEPLDDRSAQRLVVERWIEVHGAPPPDHVVERVVSDGNGHPLMLRTLVDLGGEPDGGRGAVADLDTLALSLVDRQSEPRKVLLRRASVHGSSFTSGDLVGAGPEDLAGLVRSGLLERHRSRWSFGSEVIQQAVYRSISERGRRSLHLAAGLRLEERFGSRIGEHAEALAHHFGNTDREDRQLTYFELAAERAWAAFDLEAADEWLDRLLPIAPAEARPRVHLRKGTVAEHAGRWDEAIARFELACTSSTPAVRVRARAQLAMVLSRTRSWNEAAESLQIARIEARANGDGRALFDVLDVASMTACALGELAIARDAATEQLVAAAELDDPRATAMAYANLGQLELAERDLDRARASTALARQAAEDAADERLLCEIDVLAGAVEQDRGDLLGALALYRSARHRAERVRLRYAVAMAAGNEAELRLRVGDIDGARRCGSSAVRVAAELGDLQGVVSPLGVLAEAAMAAGETGHAQALLIRVIDACARIGDRWFEAEGVLSLARLERAEGHIDSACALLDRAQSLAEGANPHVLERAALLEALLALDQGRPMAEVVVQLEQLAADVSDPVLKLETEVERWRLVGDVRSARRLASRCRALHRQAPEQRIAGWFTELVGRHLPTPTGLPPVEQSFPDTADDASLLELIDVLPGARPS